MRRYALYGLAAVLGLALLWRGIGQRLVSLRDEEVPRDAATGILAGADARELGPADADRAVLFIHGFAGCGNNFNDLPDRLAEDGWRVRVLLLPGHGTTPRDMERTTNDELLAAATKELAALRAKHKTVTVVSHSMGGAIATILASREKVDGLVLGAPYYAVTHRWYYGLHPETWDRLFARTVRWVYKGQLFLQLFDRSNAAKVVSYTYLPTKSLVRAHDLARTAAAPETLSNVRCPVLMLQSHRDRASSPKAAEAAFTAMASPDKRLVWVDRSNHHIYWDYDREEVASEVSAFLKRVAHGTGNTADR